MSETVKPINYRKETWLRGPWDKEPDRVDFIHAGFSCFINRNFYGAWCGYVGVPENHPAYGKGYDGVRVDVHGGLTYADRCCDHICHIPKPGMPIKVWWLGFDCAHSGDLIPGMRLFDDDIYRDMNYATEQTKQLAEQLRAMVKP